MRTQRLPLPLEKLSGDYNMGYLFCLKLTKSLASYRPQKIEGPHRPRNQLVGPRGENPKRKRSL